MRAHSKAPAFNAQALARGGFSEAQAVPLGDIVIRETWQVRTRLSNGTVERYANTFKEGGEAMPPIRLARCGKGLVLIDGAHRLAALELIGASHALATVEALSEDQARWAAASANLLHGLPLRKRELRAVFRAYVEAGQHMPSQRRTKSLREIAADIPGTTYQTIRNWLKADYPAVFRKHYQRGADEPFDVSKVERRERPSQRQIDRERFAEDVQQATARALAMAAATDRAWAAQLLGQALEKLGEDVRGDGPQQANQRGTVGS